MGVIAEEIKAHHVFCLGDNFYVRQPTVTRSELPSPAKPRSVAWHQCSQYRLPCYAP